MHTCFDCGGLLKLHNKRGRTVFLDGNFYLVPSEYRLSTCFECGTIAEMEYDSLLLRKRVMVPPNVLATKLIIQDNKLADLLEKTNCSNKYMTEGVIYILGQRDAYLRNMPKADKTSSNAFKRFLKRLYVEPNPRQIWNKVEDIDQVAEDLNIFADLFINVGI